MSLARLVSFPLFTGLLVGAPLVQAHAQSLPTVTADVVVTATTTPVPTQVVGRSVVTLTRDDLSRLGISSVIDGLRLLPGIDPRARGGRDPRHVGAAARSVVRTALGARARGVGEEQSVAAITPSPTFL